MLYRIFTLHPNILSSFLSESLVARALAKEIIKVELVNWREGFGIGNYKQVDDRPFGGGSGMVLKPEPIFKALKSFEAQQNIYPKKVSNNTYSRVIPNNSRFYELQQKLNLKKATIMLTPRGFSLDQKIVSWLSGFEELNILCGRYEGFDARVSDSVDLEISIGSFVLNGGEVPAMSLIESISRLLPDFVTKETSVSHDSFSKNLNIYSENASFLRAKNTLKSISDIDNLESKTRVLENINLFNDQKWMKEILPYIEHPQFTRPEVWNDLSVPKVLLSGDHKKIQNWQKNWYKE